jgi:hypothetical protein
LKGDGTYKNPGSDVIQTSQAGPNATIGINSQMFNAGDDAYFTFVRTPNANFTSFALDPNEADDADNMLYGDANAATNDTIEAMSAFLKIAQIQSGVTTVMTIAAYNIAGSPQGSDQIKARGQNAVAVTRVKVYDSAGNLLDDSNAAPTANPNLSFSFSGGVATVTGLLEGYKVEWFTASAHDQVAIGCLGGKFDIGGFGVAEPTAMATVSQLPTMSAASSGSTTTGRR